MTRLDEDVCEHGHRCPLGLCTGPCGDGAEREHTRERERLQRLAEQGVEAAQYLARGGDRL